MHRVTREERLMVDLTESPPSPSAMADALAPVLGTPSADLLRRIDGGPGPLAHDVSPQTARRVAALAAVLNLPLRVRVPQGGVRTDLSAQLSLWADGRRVAARVAKVLQLDEEDVAARLSRPGGLIFSGLDAETADRIGTLLRRTRGLVVTLSDPETAIADLFLTRPLSPGEHTRLTVCLGRVGARPDALTGAVASGLRQALRDHVLARLPDLGLLSVDRRFQRFDLHLTGTTGWVTRDLADFLVARTQQPRARFEALSPSTPVPLDMGLKHSLARQFCGDYAAIGLFVRPVLSGRAGNP